MHAYMRMYICKYMVCACITYKLINKYIYVRMYVYVCVYDSNYVLMI